MYVGKIGEFSKVSPFFKLKEKELFFLFKNEQS